MPRGRPATTCPGELDERPVATTPGRTQPDDPLASSSWRPPRLIGRFSCVARHGRVPAGGMDVGVDEAAVRVHADSLGGDLERPARCQLSMAPSTRLVDVLPWLPESRRADETFTIAPPDPPRASTAQIACLSHRHAPRRGGQIPVRRSLRLSRGIAADTPALSPMRHGAEPLFDRPEHSSTRGPADLPVRDGWPRFGDLGTTAAAALLVREVFTHPGPPVPPPAMASTNSRLARGRHHAGPSHRVSRASDVVLGATSARFSTPYAPPCSIGGRENLNSRALGSCSASHPPATPTPKRSVSQSNAISPDRIDEASSDRLSQVLMCAPAPRPDHLPPSSSIEGTWRSSLFPPSYSCE